MARNNYKGKTKGSNGSSRKGGSNWTSTLITNTQLQTDVATLGVNYALGMDYADPGLDLVNVRRSTPGIAIIELQPSIGITNSPSDTSHVAIRKLYLEMNKNNGRNSVYEDNDVGRMLAAQSSAVSFYEDMARAYYLTRLYLHDNRYVAGPLLEALGFDASALAIDYLNLRAYMNVFASKFNMLKVPKGIPMIDKASEPYKHIYTDCDDPEKSQLYVFKPSCYYRYSEGNTISAYRGSYLAPIPRDYVPTSNHQILEVVPQNGAENTKWEKRSTLMTLADIKAIGDSLIEGLMLSEDVAIITADLCRAFGDSSFELEMVRDDFILKPEFDPKVLVAIENMTLITPAVYYKNSDHTITLGRYFPYIFTDNRVNYGNQIFNYYGEDKLGASLGASNIRAYTKKSKLMNFHMQPSSINQTTILEAMKLSPNYEYGTSELGNDISVMNVKDCTFFFPVLITVYTLTYQTQNGRVVRTLQSNEIPTLHYASLADAECIMTKEMLRPFTMSPNILGHTGTSGWRGGIWNTLDVERFIYITPDNLHKAIQAETLGMYELPSPIGSK